MRILSWDIGVKNLAYQVINFTDNNTNANNIEINNTDQNISELNENKDNYEIEDWDIINLTDNAKEDVYKICKNLIIALNQKDFINKNINDIIIENQPVLKNPKMKTIQIALYSYFLIKKVELNCFDNINFMSACLKLKVYDGPEIIIESKNKYTKTKKLGIAYCKYYLELNNMHEMLTYFSNHKKKDDLADCYLQALYYKFIKINKKNYKK